MLGDFENGASANHGLSITASYDFNPATLATQTYLFGAANTESQFQYRDRLIQQKCDSISLLIQENTTGDSAEYIDLADMAFEVAVKKGVNKTPQSANVG
jgi:hypothetical protein